MAKILGTAALSLALGASALRTKEPEHPWPTMRGPLLHQFGTTDVSLPKNLSAGLLWSFTHPDGRYNTNIAGGPAIDADANVFISMNDGVRMLNQKGQVQWHYQVPMRRFNNQASLLGDKVFSCTEDGMAFALDRRTGIPIWTQKLARDAGGDAGYPAAFDGVFVVSAQAGTDRAHPGGNDRVFGLDVESGKQLWEFSPEVPVWNFEPLFPGDGSVVFMDFQGGMYGLGLHSGKELWRRSGDKGSFSDGGATLGPNGNVYACSNPGNLGGTEGTVGVLRALNAASGKLLWQQLLAQPCNSYPAVGRLGGGPELSVAVTPGSFMGSPRLHGSIMAFDAESGAPQWRYNTAPFTGLLNMAKGDIEGASQRGKTNPGHGICLPAHWSSANIDGSGFVFAGRSDGYIYGVRGAPVSLQQTLDKDFASTPGLEVQTWNADGASLHGAFAFGKGMAAFASCDTLYVFKA